jgi:AcrR family transcriptional regulator
VFPRHSVTMEPRLSDAGDMRARILDTAETLLRRHGLDKLNVIDVARAMSMSHGNVYRHVPSKAALRAAVIHRWLERVSDQTKAIADQDAPSNQRLMEWLRTLAVIKQRKVVEDAELLEAAVKVVRDMPEVQEHHAALLTNQLVGILEAGLADGTLPGVGDPRSTATAILDATTRFHHPDMVANGGAPTKQMHGLNGVIALIMIGLEALPRSP